MKGFMNILSDYFANKDYSGLFPEVVQWEKQNNLRMAAFIKTIDPKVVNHPVYFPAGVERDCVSYVDGNPPKIRRWFECNSARVPEAKLENQPKLYALLAHEIFVQAGIEKAGDANVPSTYEVSSRFLDKRNLSLETIQRYVPGRAVLNPNVVYREDALVALSRKLMSEENGLPLYSFSNSRCSLMSLRRTYSPTGIVNLFWNSSLSGTRGEHLDSTLFQMILFSETVNLVLKTGSSWSYSGNFGEAFFATAKRISEKTLVVEISVPFGTGELTDYHPDLRSQFKSGQIVVRYLYCTL
jgi:hypothetical protein